MQLSARDRMLAMIIKGMRVMSLKVRGEKKESLTLERFFFPTACQEKKCENVVWLGVKFCFDNIGLDENKQLVKRRSVLEYQIRK